MAGPDRGVRNYEPLAEELMTGLNLLRSNGDLFDVTVIIGNKPFRAHKAVLASLSGYFQVMFTNPGFVDCNQSEIKIKEEGLAPESFQHLLDFMYTSKVHMGGIQTVVDLLQVSGFFQVKGATQLCVNYLKEIAMAEDIPFVTACFMSSIANRFDHPDLKNIVDRYVGQNMTKFIETSEFQEQMTPGYLEELLMREDLNETTTEEEILEIVVAWLQFDWENRKCFTPSLLEKVRLGVIPDHVISEILDEEMEVIAQDILSRKEELQSTHRGVVTTRIKDVDVSFQVTQIHVEIQGFRNVTPSDIGFLRCYTPQLMEGKPFKEEDVYPLDRAAIQSRYQIVEDGEELDHGEIDFGNARYKFLTSMPKFLVARNNTSIPGWRLAQYAEVEACSKIIKPQLGGNVYNYNRDWYICRLEGGRIAGSGYNFEMQTGDHSTLGHQLLAKNPPRFSVTRSGKIVAGWRLATYNEVVDNLDLVKSLLKGKKAQYMCLLQGGKILGEDLCFLIEEGMFMGLEHQVLVKLENSSAFN